VRTPARVAELVYAMDSKSIVRKDMRVRIPPRALTIRRDTPADARRLAEVYVASWRAGHKGLVEGNDASTIHEPPGSRKCA
jgi:hypothetical protein